MRIVIFTVGIVTIIGSNDRNIIFFGELQQGLVNDLLLFDIVALYFYIIIFTKHVQPPLQFFLRFFFSAVQNGLRNISTNATGGSDQSLMIFFNQAFIDTRVFAV